MGKGRWSKPLVPTAVLKDFSPRRSEGSFVRSLPKDWRAQVRGVEARYGLDYDCVETASQWIVAPGLNLESIFESESFHPFDQAQALRPTILAWILSRTDIRMLGTGFSILGTNARWTADYTNESVIGRLTVTLSRSVDQQALLAVDLLEWVSERMIRAQQDHRPVR